MDQVTTFINLVSKTNGRDKFLRLIQYLTLHAIQSKESPITNNVYQQIRRVRKVLRFLRSLECSTRIRKEVTQIKTAQDDKYWMASKILTILQNLCRLLFYLSDHRVFLAQIGVIDKSHRITHYPRSYKFYFLENLFCLIKDVCHAYQIFMSGKLNGEKINYTQQNQLFQETVIDMIKCIFDMLVALFYWKGIMSAKTAGTVGTISSIIAIRQCLNEKK